MKFIEIIAVIIDPVIWAAGAAVLLFLITYAKKFRLLNEELISLHYGVQGKAVLNKKNLSLKQRDTAVSKREDIYKFKGDFNDLCGKYATLVQMIPLFPLLGILGTVAGLILQVSTQETEAIYAALNTSLSSTFYALLMAIGLKIVDSFFVLSRVNEIETTFDDYDLKLRDAISLRDFDNEDEQ